MQDKYSRQREQYFFSVSKFDTNMSNMLLIMMGLLTGNHSNKRNYVEGVDVPKR